MGAKKKARKNAMKKAAATAATPGKAGVAAAAEVQDGALWYASKEDLGIQPVRPGPYQQACEDLALDPRMALSQARDVMLRHLYKIRELAPKAAGPAGPEEQEGTADPKAAARAMTNDLLVYRLSICAPDKADSAEWGDLTDDKGRIRKEWVDGLLDALHSPQKDPGGKRSSAQCPILLARMTATTANWLRAIAMQFPPVGHLGDRLTKEAALRTATEGGGSITIPLPAQHTGNEFNAEATDIASVRAWNLKIGDPLPDAVRKALVREYSPLDFPGKESKQQAFEGFRNELDTRLKQWHVAGLQGAATIEMTLPKNKNSADFIKKYATCGEHCKGLRSPSLQGYAFIWTDLLAARWQKDKAAAGEKLGHQARFVDRANELAAAMITADAHETHRSPVIINSFADPDKGNIGAALSRHYYTSVSPLEEAESVNVGAKATTRLLAGLPPTADPRLKELVKGQGEMVPGTEHAWTRLDRGLYDYAGEPEWLQRSATRASTAAVLAYAIAHKATSARLDHLSDADKKQHAARAAAAVEEASSDEALQAATSITPLRFNFGVYGEAVLAKKLVERLAVAPEDDGIETGLRMRGMAWDGARQHTGPNGKGIPGISAVASPYGGTANVTHAYNAPLCANPADVAEDDRAVIRFELGTAEGDFEAEGAIQVTMADLVTYHEDGAQVPLTRERLGAVLTRKMREVGDKARSGVPGLKVSRHANLDLIPRALQVTTWLKAPPQPRPLASPGAMALGALTEFDGRNNGTAIFGAAEAWQKWKARVSAAMDDGESEESQRTLHAELEAEFGDRLTEVHHYSTGDNSKKWAQRVRNERDAEQGDSSDAVGKEESGAYQITDQLTTLGGDRWTQTTRDALPDAAADAPRAILEAALTPTMEDGRCFYHGISHGMFEAGLDIPDPVECPETAVAHAKAAVATAAQISWEEIRATNDWTRACILTDEMDAIMNPATRARRHRILAAKEAFDGRQQEQAEKDKAQREANPTGKSEDELEREKLRSEAGADAREAVYMQSVWEKMSEIVAEVAKTIRTIKDTTFATAAAATVLKRAGMVVYDIGGPGHIGKNRESRQGTRIGGDPGDRRVEYNHDMLPPTVAILHNKGTEIKEKYTTPEGKEDERGTGVFRGGHWRACRVRQTQLQPQAPDESRPEERTLFPERDPTGVGQPRANDVGQPPNHPATPGEDAAQEDIEQAWPEAGTFVSGPLARNQAWNEARQTAAEAGIQYGSAKTAGAIPVVVSDRPVVGAKQLRDMWNAKYEQAEAESGTKSEMTHAAMTTPAPPQVRELLRPTQAALANALQAAVDVPVDVDDVATVGFLEKKRIETAFTDADFPFAAMLGCKPATVAQARILSATVGTLTLRAASAARDIERILSAESRAHDGIRKDTTADADERAAKFARDGYEVRRQRLQSLERLHYITKALDGLDEELAAMVYETARCVVAAYTSERNGHIQRAKARLLAEAEARQADQKAAELRAQQENDAAKAAALQQALDHEREKAAGQGEVRESSDPTDTTKQEAAAGTTTEGAARTAAASGAAQQGPAQASPALTGSGRGGGVAAADPGGNPGSGGGTSAPVGTGKERHDSGAVMGPIAAGGLPQRPGTTAASAGLARIQDKSQARVGGIPPGSTLAPCFGWPVASDQVIGPEARERARGYIANRAQTMPFSQKRFRDPFTDSSEEWLVFDEEQTKRFRTGLKRQTQEFSEAVSTAAAEAGQRRHDVRLFQWELRVSSDIQQLPHAAVEKATSVAEATQKVIDDAGRARLSTADRARTLGGPFHALTAGALATQADTQLAVLTEQINNLRAHTADHSDFQRKFQQELEGQLHSQAMVALLKRILEGGTHADAMAIDVVRVEAQIGLVSERLRGVLAEETTAAIAAVETVEVAKRSVRCLTNTVQHLDERIRRRLDRARTARIDCVAAAQCHIEQLYHFEENPVVAAMGLADDGLDRSTNETLVSAMLAKAYDSGANTTPASRRAVREARAHLAQHGSMEVRAGELCTRLQGQAAREQREAVTLKALEALARTSTAVQNVVMGVSGFAASATDLALDVQKGVEKTITEAYERYKQSTAEEQAAGVGLRIAEELRDVKRKSWQHLALAVARAAEAIKCTALHLDVDEKILPDEGGAKAKSKAAAARRARHQAAKQDEDSITRAGAKLAERAGFVAEKERAMLDAEDQMTRDATAQIRRLADAVMPGADQKEIANAAIKSIESKYLHKKPRAQASEATVKRITDETEASRPPATGTSWASTLRAIGEYAREAQNHPMADEHPYLATCLDFIDKMSSATGACADRPELRTAWESYFAAKEDHENRELTFWPNSSAEAIITRELQPVLHGTFHRAQAHALTSLDGPGMDRDIAEYAYDRTTEADRAREVAAAVDSGAAGLKPAWTRSTTAKKQLAETTFQTPRRPATALPPSAPPAAAGGGEASVAKQAPVNSNTPPARSGQPRTASEAGHKAAGHPAEPTIDRSPGPSAGLGASDEVQPTGGSGDKRSAADQAMGLEGADHESDDADMDVDAPEVAAAGTGTMAAAASGAVPMEVDSDHRGSAAPAASQAREQGAQPQVPGGAADDVISISADSDDAAEPQTPEPADNHDGAEDGLSDGVGAVPASEGSHEGGALDEQLQGAEADEKSHTSTSAAPGLTQNAAANNEAASAHSSNSPVKQAEGDGDTPEDPAQKGAEAPAGEQRGAGAGSGSQTGANGAPPQKDAGAAEPVEALDAEVQEEVDKMWTQIWEAGQREGPAVPSDSPVPGTGGATTAAAASPSKAGTGGEAQPGGGTVPVTKEPPAARNAVKPAAGAAKSSRQPSRARDASVPRDPQGQQNDELFP